MGADAGDHADLGTGQGDVRIHDLLGGNYSGGDGCVLLAEGNARGRGGLPALGHGDYRGMGHGQDTSAEGDRGARRNFPGADCQRNCARRGQPGDSTPEPKTDRDVLRIAHKTQAVQIGSVCNLLCKPHVDGGHH